MAGIVVRKKSGPRATTVKAFKTFTVPVVIESVEEGQALIKLFQGDLDNKEAVKFIQEKLAPFTKL